MLEHRRVRRLLAARPGIPAADEARVRAHLAACPDCRDEANACAAQDNALRTLALGPAPNDLRDEVLRRVRKGPSRQRRLPRRLSDPVFPVSAAILLSAVAIVTTGIFHSGGRSRGLGSVPSQHTATSVPAAALLLADRIGVHGAPVVGDQPDGAGRPWTVWFHRIFKPASLGLGKLGRGYLVGTGPALFTGPLGARGEFHYFDLTRVSTDQGEDPYRGPSLTAARATHIALRWLRHAGVPIPRAAMHVRVGSGTTNIGGTGLCCFKSLATVFWRPGPSLDIFGNPPKYDVYVVDAGTVVQVDMGGLPAAEFSTHPCPGDHPDRNGVVLGKWCFTYHDAAAGIIFSEVAFHDGLDHDPDAVAPIPLRATGARGYVSEGPLRRISITPTRAIYRLVLRGTTYQATLVPAFPGLIGSTWETADVRVVRP